LPIELAPHSPKVNINKTTRSQALGLKDSAPHQVRLTVLYWCRSMLTSQNSDVNNQVLKGRDSFILSSNYPHVLPRSLRSLNDEGQWERLHPLLHDHVGRLILHFYSFYQNSSCRVVPDGLRKWFGFAHRDGDCRALSGSRHHIYRQVHICPFMRRSLIAAPIPSISLN
jgi:hypothetical protein